MAGCGDKAGDLAGDGLGDAGEDAGEGDFATGAGGLVDELGEGEGALSACTIIEVEENRASTKSRNNLFIFGGILRELECARNENGGIWGEGNGKVVPTLKSRTCEFV